MLKLYNTEQLLAASQTAPRVLKVSVPVRSLRAFISRLCIACRSRRLARRLSLWERVSCPQGSPGPLVPLPITPMEFAKPIDFLFHFLVVTAHTRKFLGAAGSPNVGRWRLKSYMHQDATAAKCRAFTSALTGVQASQSFSPTSPSRKSEGREPSATGPRKYLNTKRPTVAVC